MFPSTSSWETLRFSGNKIHCSPRDQSLSVYCTLHSVIRNLFVDSMLILSHITSSAATIAESFLKSFVTIVFSKGSHWFTMLQHFERASQNSHFRLMVLFHFLFPFPPTDRDIRQKLVRNFIPCHLLIFGDQQFASPRLLKFRFQTPRPNRQRARVKNSKWPPQNTKHARCSKGSLIFFYSYSGRM